MSVAPFPDRRRVTVSPGLWRGFDVEVFPPTQGHPLRHFKIYADALEHALGLRKAHGWQVIDQTGDPDGGSAA
jgi:hypothetical protein